MEAVFSHEGTSIEYTPSSDVAAGTVVVQGELVGVAKAAIPANVSGSLDVAGVFNVAKAAGTISVGAKAYWESTAKIVTTVATGNKLIGKVTKAAATEDKTVEVRLNQ